MNEDEIRYEHWSIGFNWNTPQEICIGIDMMLGEDSTGGGIHSTFIGFLFFTITITRYFDE